MPENDLGGSAGTATANGQQSNNGTQGTTTPVIPEGFVPVERLNGALHKIEELTLTNRSLAEQITASNTRLGELQAQGTQKDTEWTAKVGEHATKLKGVTDERDALKAKVDGLEAQQAKVKMIAEMGHFNLLAIADQIPVHTDPVKQKEAIERMAAFADQLVKGREQQLTAGQTIVTGSNGNGATTGAELPSTSEAWTRHIESLPQSSPEREAAWNQYWDWMQKHGKKA